MANEKKLAQHEFELACQQAQLKEEKISLKDGKKTIEVTPELGKNVLDFLDLLNLKGKEKFRDLEFDSQIEAAAFFSVD